MLRRIFMVLVDENYIMSKETIWIIIGVIIVLILAFVFFGSGVGVVKDTVDDYTDEEKEVLENTMSNLRASGLVNSDSHIEIENIKEKDWPDACLGINQPGRFCAEVITPGYEIVLEAENTDFTYRTNQDGSTIILTSS